MGGSGANGLKTMHLHHFKEVLFVNKRYMKGEPFLSKMVYYKRVTGCPPWGGASLSKTLGESPSFEVIMSDHCKSLVKLNYLFQEPPNSKHEIAFLTSSLP